MREKQEEHAVVTIVGACIACTAQSTGALVFGTTNDFLHNHDNPGRLNVSQSKYEDSENQRHRHTGQQQ